MNQEAIQSLHTTDPKELRTLFFSAQKNTHSWNIPMNFAVADINGVQSIAYYTPQNGAVTNLDISATTPRIKIETTGIHDCAGFLKQSELVTILIHAYGADALKALITFFDSTYVKTPTLQNNTIQKLYTNKHYIAKLPSYLLAIAAMQGITTAYKTAHTFVQPKTVISVDLKK